MKLRRLYRLVMLAVTGGMVFQTTTSCSDEAVNAFTTTVTEALGTLISSGITDYLNSYAGTTA